VINFFPAKPSDFSMSEMETYREQNWSLPRLCGTRRGRCCGEGAPPGGWVSLFNGKDLTGWKNNGEEKWVVEQGTILCESGRQQVWLPDDRKNVSQLSICDLSSRARPRATAACFFTRASRASILNAVRILKECKRRWTRAWASTLAGLYESGGRGWVAMPTAEGERALKPGEWNDFEVSAQGNHIVTQLNGVKIVEFSDPASKFTEGVIGLQIHTGGGVKMRWKDIFVQDKLGSGGCTCRYD